MRRHYQMGEATVEYGLILALATLAGLAGLIMFGPNLLSALSGMGAGMMGKSAPTGSQSLSATSSTSQLAPPPGMTTQKICFRNGSCLNLPVVSSGATVTETAGGLGGDLTSYFARIMEQVAAQMKEEGVDPATIALITDLAQTGHELGAKIDEYAKDPGKIVAGGSGSENYLSYSVTKTDGTTQYYKSAACVSEVVAYGSSSTQANECKTRYLLSLKSDATVASVEGYFAVDTTSVNKAQPPESEAALKSSLAEFETKFDLLNQFLDQNPELLAQYPEAEKVIALESQQIKTIAEGIPTVCDVGTCSVASSQNYPLTSETTSYENPKTGEAMVSTTTYKADLGGGNFQLVYKNEIYPDGASKTYKFDALSGEWTGPVVPPADWTSATVDTYVKNDATLPPKVNNATLVHQDSNVICANGGDKDQCVVDLTKTP